MDFRVIGIDTETALQRRELGRAIPPLACMSWATRTYNGIEAGLFDRRNAPRYLREWLRDPTVVLVAHNMAYDALVMMAHDESLVHLFFDAYDAGRVRCTKIRERLFELSRGMLERPKGYYALDASLERATGIHLQKEDTWRLRYGELIDVAIENWPKDAVSYAVDDARAHLVLFEAQGARSKLADEEEQARDDFALALSAAWGVRTDPIQVAKVEQDLNQKMSTMLGSLQATGLIRADGSQDKKLTQQYVLETYPGPREKLATSKGNVSAAGDILLTCTHPMLRTLSEYLDVRKLANDFLPWVKRGTERPLCPDISSLQDNGRSSYRNPNFQQMPREGGIRECFVPRPGNVFIDADYSTLEVRTFAQVLWWLVRGRTLLDLYQKDPNFDPHARLAAQILGISYDEARRRVAAKDKQAKDMRQMSKPGNFGFQGGMGIDTFIVYAWGSYQVRVTREMSQTLKDNWSKSIPESRQYFKHVGNMTRGDLAVVEQFVSGRLRGGLSFTQLANGYWSALANDGAKHSAWLIQRDCYARPNSPLYGSRLVTFIHDQFIVETRDGDNAHDAAMRLKELAVGGMRKYVPDIPIVNDPALSRRWSKDAGDPVYDRHGRLVPYQDTHRRAA